MNRGETLYFRDIELKDKILIDNFLLRYPTRKLNYCFETLYLWHESCNFQICFHNNFLLIKSFTNSCINFLYPLGEGDVCEVIENIILYSETNNSPFRLFQISASDKEILEQYFPKRFDFELSRNESEYIYNTKKLIDLSGRKFQHKRNHINYFEEHYEWAFEPLSASNLSACYDFNREWFDNQRIHNDFNSTLKAELLAIEKAFNEWDSLNLNGALLRTNGEIAAYSMGCCLSGDTYLVLFEKSIHEIRGASQQINRLFAKEYASQYVYVNRAEDSGDEGLRQAKLSYFPDKLDELYFAKLKS